MIRSASARDPRAAELQSINEWLARLRTAMLVCYAAALVLYLTVASIPGASTDTLQTLASLGTAWWAVGFATMFCMAYCASRRAALQRN
jgi:hypothetical protein